MRSRKVTILGPEGTNLYILLQFAIFNVISWFTLFSRIEQLEFNSQNILTRQIIFSIIGFIVFFLTTYISIENLYNLALPLFVLSTATLFGLLFTTPILGVRRWYDLGFVGVPIFIQPSEFAKIIIILFLSKQISLNFNKLTTLVILLVNLILIFLQPDLGTTLMIFTAVLLMFFLTEIKIKQSILSFLIVFGIFFVFLEFDFIGDYQLNRITQFFTSEDFSQQQSRLSVSSGGLYGDYFNNISENDVFVPVQTTDFIFSLFSKSFGFFGVITLFSFWILFFYRVLRFINIVETEFEKYLLSGLCILLAIQILINLLTVLGFIPLTGIAFPLLSLGGSSLFSTAIIFGLINRVFIENNKVI